MSRLFHLVLGLLIVGSGLMAGCDSNENRPARPFFEVDDRGNSRFDLGALRDRLSTLPKEPLSDQEEASLQFLREEEKLARDVYRTLYNEWNVRALDNIASSEDTHTSAVRLLLDRYDLADPAADRPDGSFQNTDLQTLHDSLLTAGRTSEIEALKVGAAVEEIDILDLGEALDTFVDNEDITLVHENLAKGSRNHLRAFVRNLERRDVAYEPQFLDLSTYQSIIESGMERGSN
jgi:Uncharacterized protein conserved in archaea